MALTDQDRAEIREIVRKELSHAMMLASFGMEGMAQRAPEAVERAYLSGMVAGKAEEIWNAARAGAAEKAKQAAGHAP